MRKPEVARLLAIAAAVDNRKLDGVAGDAALEAWWPVVGDLEYADAVEALHEHRRSAPGVYLEPGHLVQIVRDREWASRMPAPVESERAAVKEFATFTGLAREVVAARWSDVGWREARLAEARVRHHDLAIESGTA